MLKVSLILELKWCNPTGEVNISISLSILKLLEFITELLVLIHQQMGAIERRHRQIVEIGLSLLSLSHLPQNYWKNAFLTANYIINHLPTPILQNKSPYEIVFHKKPHY